MLVGAHGWHTLRAKPTCSQQLESPKAGLGARRPRLTWRWTPPNSTSPKRRARHQPEKDRRDRQRRQGGGRLQMADQFTGKARHMRGGSAGCSDPGWDRPSFCYRSLVSFPLSVVARPYRNWASRQQAGRGPSAVIARASVGARVLRCRLLQGSGRRSCSTGGFWKQPRQQQRRLAGVV